VHLSRTKPEIENSERQVLQYIWQGQVLTAHEDEGLVLTRVG